MPSKPDTLGHLDLNPEKTGHLDKILHKYRGEPGALIPVLQELQHTLGWLPREYLIYTARTLKRPFSEVFGVASFYAQFYLEPQGEIMLRVCQGTACHVRGAEDILSELEKRLGIKDGETTPDRQYSLESVACLGACGLAPVVTLNEKMYGRLTPEKAAELLEDRRH